MRKMLRLLALLLSLALVASACGSDEDTSSGSVATTPAPADTTASDEGGDDAAVLPDLGGVEVTVGVENAYLPFNYIPLGETTGTGWDYDVWAAICDLLNCVEVMTEAGWPAVIDQVANGELDVAADGISITDERAEIVAYSDAYMIVQQKFIVRLDDDRYPTSQALIDDEEALIGTQIGTTNLELAESLVDDSRISAFDQFGLAIQALISGDVDAVIIDDAAGLGYVGVNSDQIKTIDDSLQSDPLGFIFPLGSDLVEAVNLALQVLKDNGTLETLGLKYFTDAFAVTYDDIAEVGGDDAAVLPDLGGVEVTVGVENAYLPFNYIPLGETTGTGWDYDVWAAICDLLNCVEVMTEAGWPAVIDQVANGELDVAADGISITDERAEIVAYSDAYMIVQQKFIVRLDDDRYPTSQALIDDEEALIGTQIGTTNLELAESLVDDSRISAFDQFGLAIQALISGDVDAVIIDDAAGLGYVGVNSDQIKTIDDSLQSDPLGFIFPLGSDLVEAVNLALQVLKDNGTLETLGLKYFTDAFAVTYDDIEG